MTRPANDNLPYSATLVKYEIAQMLAAYPDLQDDDELRADMFEAETDLHSVLSQIVAVERDANSMIAGISERQKEIAARKARYERKKEAMRTLLLSLLRHSDLQKVSLPEATVSVSKGRDSVEITDESKLPRWAYETVRKPDKKAIMERLAANKNVPGASLKTGEPTVSVRVG